MSTYFGYVEREADSYVNWAEVSKTITDTFSDINRVREEKKDLLDQNLREELKKTALQPKGKDEQANRFISDYGSDASSFLLMQNRLLKSGRISVKDYTNATQNLTDNTDNLFKIMEDYNKTYEPSMERYKKQISSGAEPWLKSIAEGFANFNNIGSFIDTDGSVKLAQRELVKVDGKDVYKLNTNAGQMESIGVLRNAVNKEIDRVDVGKVTTDLADTTGKESRTFFEGGYKITKEGIIYRGDQIFDDPFVDAEATELALQELSNDRKKTIEFTDAKGVKTNMIGKEGEIAKLYHSALEKDDASRTAQEKLALSIVNGNVTKKVKETTDQAYMEFKKFETDMIMAALPTPESYMSVLFDAKQKASNGQQFKFARANSVEEAKELGKKNPNVIHWAVENGTLTPVLADNQKEEAVEFMRLQLRGKYDQVYKEEERTNTGRSGIIETKNTWTPEQQAAADKRTNLNKFAERVSWLYNGTPEQISEAIQYFQSSFKVLVDRTPDGIRLFAEDDKGRLIEKSAPISFWTLEDNPKAIGVSGWYGSAAQALNQLLPEAQKFDGVEAGLNAIKNTAINPNMDLFTYRSTTDPYETPIEREAKIPFDVRYKSRGQNYKKTRYKSGGSSKTSQRTPAPGQQGSNPNTPAP